MKTPPSPDYEGWQAGSSELSENVKAALENYIRKHGQPPQFLLEVSDALPEVPLPSGMQIVVRAQHIPSNIFLVAGIYT